MTTVKVVFFPLDEQLGLVEKQWSASLVKEAVWLSGTMKSYEEAAKVFERIGGIAISDSTIWRQVAQRGQQIETVIAQEQAVANALPKAGEAPRQPAVGADRMGVGIDGAMVHLRDEGWKELKVGCVYEVAQRTQPDSKTGEIMTVGQAVNNSYVAHLGGPTIFGQLLWSAASQRQWEDARTTQTIGDGAVWIWNVADEHFFRSQRTVDWYHATQHLHNAAHLLYPVNQQARSRWYNAQETLLFQGHAAKIADTLTLKAPHLAAPDALLSEAHFFRTNHQRMNYLECREEGLPIGSGMIESGAKQFKARFTGPGMRWSRPGIERLLPIRAAILSHHFDALWSSVFSSPPN
ncbi:MAG: hypothetical protein HC802_23025 [Caldilineaceae bacterium]|nr:hypothetical protein [Caldilineaceae bacterium]